MTLKHYIEMCLISLRETGNLSYSYMNVAFLCFLKGDIVLLRILITCMVFHLSISFCEKKIVICPIVTNV